MKTQDCIARSLGFHLSTPKIGSGDKIKIRSGNEYTSKKDSRSSQSSMDISLLAVISLHLQMRIAYWHRKYHSGTICKGVSNPQTSKALSGCEKEPIS